MTQSRLSDVVVEGRLGLKLEENGGVKNDAKVTDLSGKVDGVSVNLPEQKVGPQKMS